mgnify:CR=1 FL=1
MPKEYVYGEPLPADTSEVSGPVPDQPVVVVGWSRETGDMQIVTRLHDAEVPSLDESENIPAKYGYYVSLNRRGINDLIRYLRKARDQAFGRDE